MPDVDFTPGIIRQFRGRFSRGGNDIVPPEYAISELNVEYPELGVKTRSGFDLSLGPTGNWNGKAVRVYEFKKRNAAGRLLILDNLGNIWDASTAMTTAILTIATMTDFSAETLYDKVFISPHDGDRGLASEKVYIYDGTGTARAAAGTGPTGYNLSAIIDTVTGLYWDIGTHLFSVAFETSSGHITKFGLTGTEVYAYVSTASKFPIHLTGIPTGGSFVVARWIVATKTIKYYDGNPAAQDWFLFVRIPNNTDTEYPAAGGGFFEIIDSTLIDSADRLLNQLGEIPAGSCITSYGSRLVVGGERVNDATARVSDPGYPESFSGLSGFCNFNPGDAGGALRLLIPYRGMLFGFKDHRALVTRDTGDAPSTWEVTEVDAGQGTSVHGSSGVLDSKGQSLDSFLICTRGGLARFTGTFGEGLELTYAIEDLWRRINSQYFHAIQIAIDPVQKKIYIVVPLDSATVPDTMFVGDFSEGLASDKIKWSVWDFPENCPTCWVEVDWTTKKTKARYGTSSTTGLYVKNPAATNDHGNAIVSNYRPGFIFADDFGSVCQFQTIRARVVGSGTLSLKVWGLDDVKSVVLPNTTLAAAPGKEITRLLGFFDSERASVEFGVSTLNHWFHLTKIRLSASPLWEDAWQDPA